MECKITFSILSEGLTGDIGDDWEYTVTARVFTPALTSVGTITIDEHRLEPGITQQPPGGVQGITLRGGLCGETPRVELTVKAREIDWLFDDDGSHQISVELPCPGPAAPSVTLEPEIAVRVRETPKLLGGSATIRIKVRLVATCR